MKFTIEISDDDLDYHSLKNQIADEIARRVHSDMNTKKLVEEANQSIELRKKELINDWDKQSLVTDIYNLYKGLLAKEISAVLIKNPVFMAEISQEIIKTKFVN